MGADALLINKRPSPWPVTLPRWLEAMAQGHRGGRIAWRAAACPCAKEGLGPVLRVQGLVGQAAAEAHELPPELRSAQRTPVLTLALSCRGVLRCRDTGRRRPRLNALCPREPPIQVVVARWWPQAAPRSCC